MNIFGKKFRVCNTRQIMIRKILLHSYLNAFQTVKNFRLLNYRKARLSTTSYRKSSITKLRITTGTANHIKKNSVANLIARQGITSNWSPLHSWSLLKTTMLSEQTEGGDEQPVPQNIYICNYLPKSRYTISHLSMIARSQKLRKIFCQ
jgi:hypothetical protein